jgi:hypothetical protein
VAEIEFRDGKREVAPYLAAMMFGIDTYRFTFQEAIHMANRKAEHDYLEGERSKILREHFRNLG